MKTILFFTIFSTVIGYGQTVKVDHQLLWEVKGNGLKETSYIFGSYHTNDRRVFDLSDSTYFALNSAQTIVLETDVFELFEGWDTRKEDVTLLYNNEGEPYTASNKASKTLYGNEDGMPQFLDAYLLQYCVNNGKTFYPLESVDDQLKVLANTPEKSPKYRALEALVNSEERVLNIYLTGNIFALDKAMHKSMSVYPGLYERLIVERNEVMVNGLDTLMHKGALFCAIGAGHLAGDFGVINRLVQKGYLVRPVLYTKSEKGKKFKTEFLKNRTYHYTDSTRINAIFSGKPVVVEGPTNNLKLVYRELGQGNTYVVELLPIVEEKSMEEIAMILFPTPRETSYRIEFLDDGTEYIEGIMDAYPDGLVWMRIIKNDKYIALIKAYGGNKFMNSNRPISFFNKVWFD